jgi:hypothetical protein
LSSTNFNLDLFVRDDFSGNTTLMDGSVRADSWDSLVFDLTSPSLVHLTGQAGLQSFAGDPYRNSDSLYGQIRLTGPGFQFNQASLPSSFDEVFTLSPGQYTLDASFGINDENFYFLDSSSYLDMSLNADFTPAIPEPARVSTVLGVLIVFGLFFARRHAQY